MRDPDMLVPIYQLNWKTVGIPRCTQAKLMTEDFMDSLPGQSYRIYIQSVLSAIALDKMASYLINSKKQLKKKLFASINPDPVLLEEIMGV